MPEAAPPNSPVLSQLAMFMGNVRSVAAAVLHQGVDHPDVDDCASETMRRAVEGQGRLTPGEPLRPWLLGIARHVALDAVRRRKRMGVLYETGAEESDDAPSLVERQADPTAGPHELLERARARHIVQDSLSQLPPSMAQALMKFHVEGKSYQEIAQELGVPLGTVATWVFRGRKALAEGLSMKGVEL